MKTIKEKIIEILCVQDLLERKTYEQQADEILSLTQWVSVNDRLPEIKTHGFSEWVLASTGHIQMEVARYDHDYNTWFPKSLNFTHWMPLPEPPNKNNNNLNNKQ